MELHRLMFHEKGEGDNVHVHVTGHMLIEHEGAQLTIPISHKLSPSDPPERHQQILDTLESHAKIWAKRRGDFSAWIGAKETHGEISIEITDCHFQHHAIHDWKLYVAWLETHNGVTVKLRKVFTYSTPAQAMDHESLKALVRGEVLARSGKKADIAKHKEAFRAVHFAHSAAARRVQAPGGQGDPAPGGPPVGPGKGK